MSSAQPWWIQQFCGPILRENQMETIFHTAVPYRISQIIHQDGIILCFRDCNDAFEKRAPKILAIKEGITFFAPAIKDLKTLTFGDKIFVSKIQSSKHFAISSSNKAFYEKLDARYFFKFDGIVVLALHDSSVIRCWDFSYISRIDVSEDEYWITDRKNFDHRKISKHDEIYGLPRESIKLGIRLRSEYIKFPKNSFHHSHSSLRILPTGLKFYGLDLPRKSPPEDILIALGRVEKLETINDLSNDLIGLYSCLFCIFTKDKIESIEEAFLNWNIAKSGYAQVTYKSAHDDLFDGKKFHNYANSLFTRGSTAILKRQKKEVEKEELNEIHVKINESNFKEDEISIGFKVKVDDVMKEWKLNSTRELSSGRYTIEPADIFAHWRPFIEKLVEGEDYLGKILRKAAPSQAAILKAFMPYDKDMPKFLLNEENMQICQNSNSAEGQYPQPQTKPVEKSQLQKYHLPDPIEEERSDRNLRPGQLPYAHRIARAEIAKQKPIVVIDGAPQTGKTTFNTFIIPDILQQNFENIGNYKCLALVGPTTKTLTKQVELIQKSLGYCMIERDVRILNLLDFNDLRHGCFMKVLEKTLKEYPGMTYGEREKLKAGINLIKTRFCGFHRENTNGYDRDIIIPNLNKEEKKVLAESAEAYVDLISSKELLIFQDAVSVIFYYYQPNFIIASNETFISFLPSMNGYISQIIVDEAGKTPFLEVLNMIVETPKLKQLILNGDTTQYPYYHRVHLEPRPECYDNCMKMINIASSELSYIQFNKTFYMHPGIVKVINETFYSGRILMPIFPPESYELQFKNLNVLRDFEIPIGFHNVPMADEYVPPTTRKNYYQSFVAMKLIQKLLSTNNFQNQRILVLCNYSAEKEMLQENLKRKGFGQKMIKVKCVDNSGGEHSDIVIYITTRAIDEKRHSDGAPYDYRFFEGSYELGDLRDNFHYVFERQRILTAISRARKAVFIIGSQFLLDNCPAWKHLIQMIEDNHFSYPNISEQLENEWYY